MNAILSQRKWGGILRCLPRSEKTDLERRFSFGHWKCSTTSTKAMTELCTLDLLYFDGVEIEDCEPRAIFISNACHVCKTMRHDSTPKNQVKLLSCSGCRLIAYCGAAHQKEHWPQHKVWTLIIHQVHTANDPSFHYRTCAKSFRPYCAKTTKRVSTTR